MAQQPVTGKTENNVLVVITLIVSIFCLAVLVFIAFKSSYNRHNLEPKAGNLPDFKKLHEKGNKGTIPEDDAAEMIDVYRTSVTFYKMAKGTYYNTLDVNAYVTAFLKHAGTGTGTNPDSDPFVNPPDGFKWQLTSSLMFVKDKDEPRLSACLIPVIVDKNTDKPTNVYDFFDEKSKKSDIYNNYFEKLNAKFLLEKDASNVLFTSFIYDEGHLWP